MKSENRRSPSRYYAMLTQAEQWAVDNDLDPHLDRQTAMQERERLAQRALARRKEERRRNDPDTRSGRWSDGRLYYHVATLARHGCSVATLVGRLVHDARHKIAEHGEDAVEWDTLADWAYTLGLSARQTRRTVGCVARLGFFGVVYKKPNRWSAERAVYFSARPRAVKLAAAIAKGDDRLEYVSRALAAALGLTGAVLYRRIRAETLRTRGRRPRAFAYSAASLRTAMPWLRSTAAFRVAIHRLVRLGLVEAESHGRRQTYRIAPKWLALNDAEVAAQLRESVTGCPSVTGCHRDGKINHSASTCYAENPEKSPQVALRDVTSERYGMSREALQDVRGVVVSHWTEDRSSVLTGSRNTESSGSAPAAPETHRERFAGEGAPASAPTGASAGSPPRRERVSAVAGEETEVTDEWGAEAAREEADRQREEEEGESIRKAYAQHLDHIREVSETEVSETETGTVRGKASPVDSVAGVPGGGIGRPLPPTTERDRQLLRNLAACDLHRLCDWATTDPAVVVIAAAAGVRLTRPDQPPGWSPAEAAAADARWRQLMAHHRALDLRLDPSGSFAR